MSPAYLFLRQSPKVCIILILILQMRALRHREVNRLLVSRRAEFMTCAQLMMNNNDDNDVDYKNQMPRPRVV